MTVVPSLGKLHCLKYNIHILIALVYLNLICFQQYSVHLCTRHRISLLLVIVEILVNMSMNKLKHKMNIFFYEVTQSQIE